ncbi:MAG: hypothetical protein K2P54_01995 [Odoribacter sp.]|nr:hypothetical protein [Odoribacter sp.]
MERYAVITEDIENVTNREVVRQNRISMVSIGFILLSVFLALWAFSITDPNSSFSTFLLTTAVFMLFGGIVKFCMGRRCYFFKPTGSPIKHMTLYFDNKESQHLKDCMEQKRFEILKGLKRQINTGVKVDAMIAADSRFVALQVSEYVPYTYEAVSPVMCYYENDALLLSDYFKNSR